MKTSKNDNKSVWIKSREHLHVEWPLFFVLFPWKSCNVNGRRCQGLMAASGMIQIKHLDILKIIPVKTFQKQRQLKVLQNSSKTIFFIFGESCAGQMRKKKQKTQKIAHPRQDIQTRHVLPFWQRGGQRLKLCSDLDGFPLYFWPSERRPDIKRSPKKRNLRTFMSVANLSLRPGKKCFKLHQSYLISFTLAKFSWVQSERTVS